MRANAARRYLAGLLAVLVTGASGCSSWKELKVPPAQYLAEKPHTIIRAGSPEEGRVMLRVVRVSGDSLIADRWRAGRTPSDWNGTRPVPVALPIASLSHVEARHINGPKTAAVVVLFTGIAVMFFENLQWRGPMGGR